ncbi:MAG TPA: hybrid sensor histidine kinase/response regulator [Candidatus Polarisedimenticolia bacterium]|nr:hybrid sensor histidine kinase/response regulator [Candidatus Polarisedimenticolia bacterium]
MTERLRRALSLRTQLLLFSGLLTVAVVGVMFALLGVTVRNQTRRLLTATLIQHQQRMAAIQRSRTAELVRASVLLTESPTLRAALETYETERNGSGAGRGDLLETIQHEVTRVASGLDRDLVVMTDLRGGVLAARARDPADVASATAGLRRAATGCAGVTGEGLGEGARVPARSELVSFDGRLYQVGCVPILLGGDVIGGLVLGDRIDQAWVDRVRDDLGADALVLSDGRVVASSRPGTPEELPAGTGGPAGAQDGSGHEGTLLTLADEELVAVSVPLAGEGRGSNARLVLMHSLTKALAPTDRSLRQVLLLYGVLALVLAVAAATIVARSVLRPLDRFVAFLRQVTETRDRGLRFDEPGGPEIQTLATSYNHLMAALLEHERRLLLQAREELDRMERLKESEKLAALGRMLSGAAHEINNPLAGVLGNIDLLLGDASVPVEARRRLETVRREGQRIVGLVRNLLKTVHRDDGHRSLVDLNQVARDSAALRRHDFQTAGILLEVDLPGQGTPVLGSELELQQVFLNVLNNAFDALTDARVENGRLAIQVRRDGGDAVVEFADNGPGLKEPEKVFEHFYTTKPVGRGTGLGLSITSAIVRNHGGRIEAANRPAGGACFTLRLPAQEMPEVQEPMPPRHAAGGATAAPGPRRPARLAASVLVVDDEPSVLELQIAILETYGAQVTGARSGATARDLLRELSFDLVVTDLRMPGEVSGQDLYRWARVERPGLASRFVFVTGDTMSESALAFLEATGRRCVQKPFSVEGYLDVLRDTLNEKRAAA